MSDGTIDPVCSRWGDGCDCTQFALASPPPAATASAPRPSGDEWYRQRCPGGEGHEGADAEGRWYRGDCYACVCALAAEVAALRAERDAAEAAREATQRDAHERAAEMGSDIARLTAELRRGPPRRAKKIGGSYQAEGWVVAEFRTRAGLTRFVFEFDVPSGMLHIFSPQQIEFLPEDPSDLEVMPGDH